MSFPWENRRRKNLPQFGCIVPNPWWLENPDYAVTEELMQRSCILSQPGSKQSFGKQKSCCGKETNTENSE